MKKEKQNPFVTLVAGLVSLTFIFFVAMSVFSSITNEQETRFMQLNELDFGYYNLQNVTLQYVTPKACFASSGCRSELNLVGQQVGSNAKILCTITKEYEMNGKLVFYCYRG